MLGDKRTINCAQSAFPDALQFKIHPFVLVYSVLRVASCLLWFFSQETEYVRHDFLRMNVFNQRT